MQYIRSIVQRTAEQLLFSMWLLNEHLKLILSWICQWQYTTLCKYCSTYEFDIHFFHFFNINWFLQSLVTMQSISKLLDGLEWDIRWNIFIAIYTSWLQSKHHFNGHKVSLCILISSIVHRKILLFLDKMMIIYFFSTFPSCL